MLVWLALFLLACTTAKQRRRPRRKPKTPRPTLPPPSDCRAELGDLCKGCGVFDLVFPPDFPVVSPACCAAYGPFKAGQCHRQFYVRIVLGVGPDGTSRLDRLGRVLEPGC